MEKNNLDLCIDKKQVCFWEIRVFQVVNTASGYSRLLKRVIICSLPQFPLEEEISFLDTVQENKCWKRKKKDIKKYSCLLILNKCPLL